MNDNFEVKVRTMASAGWGVAIFCYLLVLVQWGFYVWAMATHRSGSDCCGGLAWNGPISRTSGCGA